MSRRRRSQPPDLDAAPGVACHPLRPLADELQHVVLLGLSPAIAAHLMEPIRAVVHAATLEIARPADLGSPPAVPERSLLVLQDASEDGDGLEVLRRLRAGGVDAPAILIVAGNDFEYPTDLDVLGDLDLITLSESSRFAFRRSLALLGAQAARERLVDEARGRLAAYEQMLAARDEEHRRLLAVAEALEQRLFESEAESQKAEVRWNERLAHSSAYVAELEKRVAELEEHLNDASADGSRRRRQLALELAFHREESLTKDAQLAELRETCREHEQELRRLSAREAQLGDLTDRLEASEKVRAAQTRELLAGQRRIAELEDQLGTVGTLLEAGKGSDGGDPDAMLEELAQRLSHVDSVRSEQQGTIDRLSHSLAVQQVDDALDDAQSRRNAVRRVDEAVQRSRRFGVPMICLMIGIDRQSELRTEHGSVLFDFILVQVAHRLQLALRRDDVVMRYGDGEFLLITDAKTVEAAESHALRLVRAVCAEPLELGGRKVQLDLSVAVLPYHRDLGEAPEVIRRARQCLLEAQTRGVRQILVGSIYEFGAAPPNESDGAGASG